MQFLNPFLIFPAARWRSLTATIFDLARVGAEHLVYILQKLVAVDTVHLGVH